MVAKIYKYYYHGTAASIFDELFFFSFGMCILECMENFRIFLALL